MVEGLAPVVAGFCDGAGMKFGGIVTAPTEPAEAIEGLHYFVGGHPIPNEASLRAGRAILEELQSCDERTLVFFLLSGGGSALVELPIDPAQTLEDVQGLYSALVTCGAPIADLGKVRRHLSAVKGGRLAAAAGRATKITLAVSDVPKRQEAALASGPTIPDPTTVDDAMQVIAGKYDDCVRGFRGEFASGSTRVEWERRQSRARRRFLTRIFRCCWGWMICFIRRIERRRGWDLSRAATTRQTIGRWWMRRSIC